MTQIQKLKNQVKQLTDLLAEPTKTFQKVDQSDVLRSCDFYGKVYLAFKRENAEIVSAEEMAVLMEMGVRDAANEVLSRIDKIEHSVIPHAISNVAGYKERYGFCGEAYIHQPKNPSIVLVTDRKYNPILSELNKNGITSIKEREFYLDDSAMLKLLNAAEKDPKKAIKSHVLALQRSDKERIEVPVEILADNPFFAFILRDEAEKYGKVLKTTGVNFAFFTLSPDSPYYDEGDYLMNPKHNGRAFASSLYVGRLPLFRPCSVGETDQLMYGLRKPLTGEEIFEKARLRQQADPSFRPRLRSN